MIFGELLKSYMKEIGISDVELARKLKVDRSTIIHWKKGEVTRPKCETVTKCIAVLRLDERASKLFLEAAGCPRHLEPTVEKKPTRLIQPILRENLWADNFITPIVGIPIKEPYQFFGRKAELTRIFNKITRLPLQHIAITGERRSGKTSLLYYVKNIHTAPQLRPNQYKLTQLNCRLVFLDFQDPTMCQEQSLLHYLLQQIDIPIPHNECDLRCFIEIIRDKLSQPTIILMDEIDAAFHSPQLNEEFWWGMRALFSSIFDDGRLGFIIASHKSPVELRALTENPHHQPSPFLNIIGEIIKMIPFTEPEARELLNYVAIADADKEWILSHSGLWPASLQILCNSCLNANTDWKIEGLERVKEECKHLTIDFPER